MPCQSRSRPRGRASSSRRRRWPRTRSSPGRSRTSRPRSRRRAARPSCTRRTCAEEVAQIESLVSTTVKELGGLDILINNAGALFWAPVEQTPAKRFNLVVDVNVRAAFLCAAAAIPHLRKRGGGSIVNMSPPVTPGCRTRPGRVHDLEVRDVDARGGPRRGGRKGAGSRSGHSGP